MNNFNISSYSLGLWRRGFLAAGARGVGVGAGVWDRADSPFLALNRRDALTGRFEIIRVN